MTRVRAIQCIAFAVVMSTVVHAQDQDPVGLTPTPADAAGIGKKPNYSPYAGRSFPTRPYWGDTHIHTRNSLDARGFGCTLGPEVPMTIQERAYTSPIWYTP